MITECNHGAELGCGNCEDKILIESLTKERDELKQEVETEYKRCGCEVGPNSETGEPYAWCMYHKRLRAERDALKAERDELKYALENLFALVQGECPSLLENDHHYDMVLAALKGKPPSDGSAGTRQTPTNSDTTKGPTMNAEQIARVAHEVNRAYCQALGDNSQPAWEDALPAAQQAKDYIFRGVVLALAHAPVMAAEPSAEQKP